MAYVIQKTNKSIEIRFTDVTGNSRSLYPGKLPTRDAQAMCTKIEHIVNRQLLGAEIDYEVAAWLSEIPDRLYSKFVKLGLVAPRLVSEQIDEEPAANVFTIKQWTDRYIEKHPGKPATIEQLEVTARSLCKYLGDMRLITEINAGHAEEFRKWLQSRGNERKDFKAGLAEGTVRRRIGRCKQFFNAAIKHELIQRNPFAGEASATGGNPERMEMVSAESVEACIRKAPCEDWRIILAFARYGGMRSHETRIQKWEDIDLANNTMLVRSNKTPSVRRCPIFPELRPHLLRAREMAPEGAVYVQTRYEADDNIHTTLIKIIERAGLVPWQKPMQNMRATRETELLACYPAKDVTSWLGNSPNIANKHYAMTMQESFVRAISEGATIAGVTAKVGNRLPKITPSEPYKSDVEKTPQNPPQTEPDEAVLERTAEHANSEKHDKVLLGQIMSHSDTMSGCPTRTRT